jgi:MtfA peptidase
VTNSAQACLLLLVLPHEFYRNVLSSLVYPSTVVSPKRKLGHFEVALAPIEAVHPIIGQAFQQGPVILIWDTVLIGKALIDGAGKGMPVFLGWAGN